MSKTSAMILLVTFVAFTTYAHGHPAFSTKVESHHKEQQLPAGISDLLAATPTMLTSLSAPMMDQNKAATTKAATNTGNTVTISGSKIVFAKADKQTLVQTIESLLMNSEPGTVGDKLVTRAIMAVLDIGDNNKVMLKQIEVTLDCRKHKQMGHKCVEKLVDMATKHDENATKGDQEN